MDSPSAYAQDVVTEKIPANELVRLSCQDHLERVELAKSPGYYLEWDPVAATAICEYAKRHTNVQDFATGYRIPFDPLPWQRFFLGSIFGWKLRSEGLDPRQPHPDDPMERLPGTRRFRNAVLLTGRGAGKSPIGLLIAQFMLLQEPTFNGVCLGSIDAQAWRPFKLMREMMGANVDPQGFIDTAFEVTGAHRTTGGLMRIGKKGAQAYPELAHLKGEFVSTSELANAEKRVGGMPSFVMVEEFQAHTSSASLNAYVSGFKARAQPLLLFTMNAPVMRIGPAWEMLQTNRGALLDGNLRDDTFHMEYAIDKGDLKTALKKDKKGKYVPDAKKVWEKANPSLGYTVRPDYYVSELQDLESQSTQDRSDAIRQLFSVTPEHLRGDIWFEVERWRNASVDKRPEWVDKEKPTAYFGLDIGMLKAFTALATVWKHPKGKAHCEVSFYTHEKDLKLRGDACGLDLVAYMKRGWLNVTPGEYCDLRYLVREIKKIREGWHARVMAADPHRVSESFTRAAADEGLNWDWVDPETLLKSYRGRKLPVVMHPQGGNQHKDLSMRIALERAEKRLNRSEPTMTVLRNPLLDAMFAWSQTQYGGGTGPLTTRGRWIKVDDADAAAGKAFCDGIVALAMAVAVADWEPHTGKNRNEFANVLAQQRKRLGLDSDGNVPAIASTPN